MNELLGKLTNLSYEIFGVLLPGLTLICLFATIWMAVGPASLFFSFDILSPLTYEQLESWSATPIDLAALGFSSYILGHVLIWFSRTPGKDGLGKLNRFLHCLRLKIPRPTNSFDAELDPLFTFCCQMLGVKGNNRWRQFYPIAKVLLAEKLSRSLVSTYQNKYTFHRSITALFVLVFWLCSTLLVIYAVACVFYKPPEMRLYALTVIWASSILIITKFSDSFSYYWVMFGNCLITETYGLLKYLDRRTAADSAEESLNCE